MTIAAWLADRMETLACIDFVDEDHLIPASQVIRVLTLVAEVLQISEAHPQHTITGSGTLPT